MGDGDGVSGWQGAATPSAIIAPSVASALTSSPQGRPKGLSSAVASGLGAARFRAGAGRSPVLKAAGRTLSSIRWWQVQVVATIWGQRRSPMFRRRSCLRACEGVADRGGLRRIGRRRTAARAAGGCAYGGVDGDRARSRRGPPVVRLRFRTRGRRRAGHRPVPRKALPRRPSGQRTDTHHRFLFAMTTEPPLCEGVWRLARRMRRDLGVNRDIARRLSRLPERSSSVRRGDRGNA
jgi:hypothetical protein